jgi:predicted CXXCH cytochrome family protein
MSSLLAGPSPLICTSCHEDVTSIEGAKSIHAPSQGDCLDCHVPHGGAVEALLTESVPPLCFECHDEGSADFRQAHLGMDASGMDCASCHEAHQAGQASLLYAQSHAPFEEGDCSVCHDELDAGTPAEEICAACHDLPWTDPPAGSVVHAPFEAGECGSCHNPHVAPGENLLLAASTAETCGECHEISDLYPDPDVAHEPVRQGQCDQCHESHGSEHASLLKEPGKALCFGCHGEMRDRAKLSNVHEPFADGSCATCHDAHGSSMEGALVEALPGLCFACHDPVADQLPQNHNGMSLEGVDCTGCHDPHASNSKALAYDTVHEPYGDGDCGVCHEPGAGGHIANEKELCFGCHAGMAEDIEKAELHEPLTEGRTCSSCHGPHTAPQAKLLAEDQEGLCSGCHREVAESMAASAHSHPPQSTGACSACHDPHIVAEEGRSVAEGRCASCHPFSQHVMHPMGSGVQDPRTGEELGCLSCHDQHGSEFEFMLLDDPNGRLCVACHTDKIRTK